MRAVDVAELSSVSFDGQAVTIIDQTRLPAELGIMRLESVEDLVEAIVSLRVRGAPAIGIAGAYGVAMALAQVCADEYGATCTPSAALRRLEPLAQRIREARPTAVNLAWAVDRVMARLRDADLSSLSDLVNEARLEADRIRDEDAEACSRMGRHAQALIPDGARILTHCNTGLLCTGGIGTALGAIRVAHQEGRVKHVLASETRPLRQGGRLTAWELGQLGIPFELIVDGAAAGLISRGEVDLVIVGADRIAANGDTANKVGTLAHALAAKDAGIPFVVVAPSSTVDVSTPDGAAIRIEERPASEVTSDLGVPVRNPAFDVTPARLISAIVTESGIHRPPFADLGAS